MKPANDNSRIYTPEIILAVRSLRMGLFILLTALVGFYVFFEGV